MDIVDPCPGKKAKCTCMQHLNRPHVDPWKHDNGEVIFSNINRMEQLAKTKVFTSIMLNAWRQRRADVRLLKQRVEKLEKNAMRVQNELHVSRTLMRVEQKRCKELQQELTNSALNIRHVRKSYDELSNSLHSLKTEKEQLEEQLNTFKTQEANNDSIGSKSSEELHKTLLEQRETIKQLSEQQSQVRRLKSDQKRLLKKMLEMENEYGKCRESYVQQLEQKDKELRDMRLTNESLETQLQDLQRKRSEINHNVKIIEWTPNTWVKPASSDTQLTQRGASKGIREILSSIRYYTSAAIYFLWIAFLPRKSQRFGCTQASIN